MKTKIMLVLCACWLVATWLTAADVSSITRDVEINSNSELMGVMLIEITEDAFPDASPTNPVYLEVHLENGLALRETLVDPRPSAQGPSPIYLPIGNESLLAPVAAAPDTLSIVRWIAGEPSYWLKIQSSSRTWISNNDGTQAPDDVNWVDLLLSSSAKRYWSQFGEAFRNGRSNLPYATRDLSELSADDVTRAVSVNLCADIRRSVYINRGTPDKSVFLSAGLRAVRMAENDLAAQRHREIPVGENYPFAFRIANRIGSGESHPSFRLGRTYNAACTTSFSQSPNEIPSCTLSESGLTDVNHEARGLTWACSSVRGPYLGSRFQFRWPNSQAPVGFRLQTEAGGQFVDAEGISGQPNTVLLVPEALQTTASMSPPYAYLSDVTEIAGEMVAVAAEVIYRPEDPDAINDRLEFDATMRAAMNRAVTTADLNLVVTARIAAQRPPEDPDPEFSGPEQNISCPTFFRVLTGNLPFGSITSDCPPR